LARTSGSPGRSAEVRVSWAIWSRPAVKISFDRHSPGFFWTWSTKEREVT
jgi:hypothetical protein